MLRVKISNFIKNNSEKLKDVGKKLMIVAIVVLVATIMLSYSSKDIEEKEDTINVYRPTQTIIEGADVSEEQYEKDSNIVDDFLDFCNNNKVEEAYSLLTDACKQEQYPTLEDFKKYYQEIIFKDKRQYNLQAWISTYDYTVYKIRYTENILESGSYNEENIYQDYITLNKSANVEKVSIGNFIHSENCEIVTNTNLIKATVTKKTIYMSYEEYDITLQNKSDKTILLDNLESGKNIKLVGDGVKYAAYTNKLFLSNLKLKPGEIKRLTIKFKKYLNSDNASESIEFAEVIKDYNSYEIDTENYKDTESLKIKLED